jgi:polyisoprenoid-binding protein YceI
MSWLMKILWRLFSVLGLCVLSSSMLVAAPERYKIDTTHSSVSFKIRHLGVSWVQGVFKDYEGEVLFDPEKPEASSVTVTVKAASVDTGNEKRDNHLRNADYFHVEKFPTLSFKSTKVEKTGENRYKVTGDFTLLGVTKPLVVDFIATDEIEGMRGEKRRGGETSFTIKRSDFGMKQSIGPIGDEVHVSLSFAGVKD